MRRRSSQTTRWGGAMVMPKLPCFERLLESVVLIVRHPPYPGKEGGKRVRGGGAGGKGPLGGLPGSQGGALLEFLGGGPTLGPGESRPQVMKAQRRSFGGCPRKHAPKPRRAATARERESLRS